MAALCAAAVVVAGLSGYYVAGGRFGHDDSTLSATPPAGSSLHPPPERTRVVARHADFRGRPASDDARHIADWVVDSGDNHDIPFVIVDKINARVFAFDAHGELTGSAPALLGIAKGDESAPGVGEKALSEITTQEKTTPAGRFVAELGRNLHEDVLWIDYDAGVSMHRVLRTNPEERRQQRLDTPSVADNRISFGCINVPVAFYEKVIRAAFTGTRGIVYVLPETKPVRKFFGAYDVDQRAALRRSLPQPGGTG